MPETRRAAHPSRTGPDPLFIALAAPVSVILGLAAVMIFLGTGLAAAAAASHVLAAAG